MADELDLASEREQLAREAALTQRLPTGPAATGACLNPTCEDNVPPGVRWCCAGCRDEWQRRRKIVTH
jgi:hypothetical protein